MLRNFLGAAQLVASQQGFYTRESVNLINVYKNVKISVNSWFKLGLNNNKAAEDRKPCQSQSYFTIDSQSANLSYYQAKIRARDQFCLSP
jgi:hypothetical protein